MAATPCFTDRDELEDILTCLERLLPKLERIFNALPAEQAETEAQRSSRRGRGSKKPPAKQVAGADPGG